MNESNELAGLEGETYMLEVGTDAEGHEEEGTKVEELNELDNDFKGLHWNCRESKQVKDGGDDKDSVGEVE